jgi:transposase
VRDHRAALLAFGFTHDVQRGGQTHGHMDRQEELRALLAGAAVAAPHQIHQRLLDFYIWCARVDVPEVTALAELIDTWWPAVLTFLETGVTNAATEGTNRLIKQVKRQACGFRNRTNYRERVRFHCTRSRERARARGLPT